MASELVAAAGRPQRSPSVALHSAVYLLFLLVLALIALAASFYLTKPYVGGQIALKDGLWVVAPPPWGSLAQVQDVRPGAEVIAVNGRPVAEFAGSASFIPSRKVHSLTLMEPGGTLRTLSDEARPVPWQTSLAGTMQGLLALLLWLAAVVAWVKRPGLGVARLFALWAVVHAVLLAAILGAQYDVQGMVLLRTLGYLFGPALFLHLFLIFPRSLVSFGRSLLVYAPALVLALVYAILVRQTAAFDAWFRTVVLFYMLLGYGTGVAAYAYGYFTADHDRHRLQAKLTVAAAFLGLLPFLVLSLLPQIISDGPIVSGNLTILGTAAIPLMLAYVIVREKLPTLRRDGSLAYDRADAKSLAIYANLATDLETLSAYLTQNIASKVGVGDACLLVVGDRGLRVTAAVGSWTNSQAKQAQLVKKASRLSQDGLFPNLAPRSSGCAMLVPLQSRGEMVGLLCLGTKVSGAGFKERDIDFLSDVRTSVVVPLHNAILLDTVNETKRSLRYSLDESQRYARDLEAAKDTLEKAYLDMGRTLILMLESRDPYTRGHSERVGRLSANMARQMDLSSEETETLSLAAMFHDIGKVAISDTILLKRGPLEPQQRAEMELHPGRGLEILRFLSFMGNALPIVEAHHEAWDGSGYPRALRGEEIPLCARILAVADAYDAMTSARPYRAAFTSSEAVERLKAGAGHQWDPQVVEAFLATMDVPQE